MQQNWHLQQRQHQRNVSAQTRYARKKKQLHSSESVRNVGPKLWGAKRSIWGTRRVLLNAEEQKAEEGPWHVDRCGGATDIECKCQTQAKAKNRPATALNRCLCAESKKWERVASSAARCGASANTKTLTTFSIVCKMQMCPRLPSAAGVLSAYLHVYIPYSYNILRFFVCPMTAAHFYALSRGISLWGGILQDTQDIIWHFTDGN